MFDDVLLRMDAWQQTAHASSQGVEIEPNNPHIFWSAAEDGTVRQYDTRLSANSQKAWESSNCLLYVKAPGPASSNHSVELKGISLNKVPIQIQTCSSESSAPL